MQGLKDYQEKLFMEFRLSERVPENNFYRRLKDRLDLSYIRQMTRKYYGSEGQKSLDPEVFFQVDVDWLFGKYPFRQKNY
jgi:transposase